MGHLDSARTAERGRLSGRRLGDGRRVDVTPWAQLLDVFGFLQVQAERKSNQ